MSQYTYFILGILLGLAIAIYFWISREEKIEKSILRNRQVFSTEKLDETMEDVVNKIREKVKIMKRELTEEEKNEIIVQCYKEKFYV